MPKLPRDRAASYDAHDPLAKLTVDTRPPRGKGEFVAFLDDGKFNDRYAHRTGQPASYVLPSFVVAPSRLVVRVRFL